jgi:molybdopterin-guanine dinucleotide biosynthesis protein A
VDLPGLSTGFLGRLMAKRRAGGGVVPIGVRGLEPLCAVYPVGQALAAVKAWDGSGECSPRRLVSDGLKESWMESWRVEEPDQACLVNWNRPGDWDGGSAGFGFRRMKGPVRVSGAA